ncbi:MAG: pcpA [Clostridiaceae bacterium]|nr:pcpA [Clostridiaceae bacterium]
MFKKKFAAILLSTFITIGSLGFSQNAVKASGVNGWLKNGTTWNYYINGNLKTGWQLDGVKWYYLNTDGSMAAGWKQVSGYWYYLNPSGDMAANKWVGNYYLGASGAMAVSTVTPDGYYVDASGAWDGKPKGSTVVTPPIENKKTGWQLDGDKWYYFNTDGSMATGWKQVSGLWYYLNPSGDMAANKWVGNYYLGDSGAMLVNTVTPDGYYVNANGVWDGKPRRIKTVYNVGETAVIQDSLWGTYELTVNSVEITDERNEYWDTTPAEVYKITYTYKLLSKGSTTIMGLYIGDFDGVTDSTGEAGEVYPGNIINYPKELYNVGDFCTAETFVGVNNPTTKLVLSESYFDSSLGGYITFNIPTK